ncbi:Protein of unknown function DUF2179 [Desulfurispirillum indicum S5]|uniref:UPF0316 protein Selin_1349 n=1 Tax=Desulfurispirillum indicum (strain ATCC BAA-1389 / DSM 22839 / S5) TaxID=653733 RepID=E6W5Q3_DESIS|nr:DUF2179 domain-containing protein [Desulfurispirillum indicum]ADU66084.1 Protein of unknown function DUF2179 [Desulfurispirillum indicum S5]
MDELSFTFSWFSTLLLPLLIMIAKVVEVAVGTIRIMFVSRGMKYLAPLVGFIEVIIWLAAITQVMSNMGNIANYVAYAIGFTVGNYLGIIIEERISLGYSLVRVITRRDATELVHYLKESRYHVTHVDAEGELGDVKVIFTTIRRRELPRVLEIIKTFNPRACYTIEDLRFVSESGLPHGATRSAMGLQSLLPVALRRQTVKEQVVAP